MFGVLEDKYYGKISITIGASCMICLDLDTYKFWLIWHFPQRTYAIVILPMVIFIAVVIIVILICRHPLDYSFEYKCFQLFKSLVLYRFFWGRLRYTCNQMSLGPLDVFFLSPLAVHLLSYMQSNLLRSTGCFSFPLWTVHSIVLQTTKWAQVHFTFFLLLHCALQRRWFIGVIRVEFYVCILSVNGGILPTIRPFVITNVRYSVHN